MKRALYESLVEWKNASDRKPLVVEGARQVGKTWLIKEFGENEFENMVYLNCDNNPDLESLFQDYDINRVLRVLTALTGQSIQAGKTLIVFDEVQELPRGLAALKYFYENAPEYHVVVAGSLLGISLNEGTGFPVGKVDHLKLYPLSFKEFLMALGENALIDLMEHHSWSDFSSLSNKMTDLLRQYYYVGGMPEVVSNYVKHQDVQEVRKRQESILADYRRDFPKHAPKAIVPKINQVWDCLATQLAKENKKFIYGAIRTGARAKEYEDAIQWLLDAGLVYKVTRVSKLVPPMNFYNDSAVFKLFALDVGLLGAMAGAKAKDVLVNNNVFEEYKGAFSEEFILQEMKAAGYKHIHYFTNENSTNEIDFVVEPQDLVAIEVKAEENLQSKSLKTVLKENDKLTAWRFSMKGYDSQEQITNIPLYLAGDWFSAHPEID